MRKITEEFRAQVAKQEAHDEALAGRLSGLMSWADKSERAIGERADDLVTAVRDWQAKEVAELRVFKAELTAVIAELRGAPTVIEGDKAPAPPQVERRDEKEAA